MHLLGHALTPEPIVFRAATTDTLSAREADGFRLVYDRRSGDTHMLAPDLAAVLDALGEAPADAAGVLARLRRDQTVEAEHDPEMLVGVRLGELVRLGLADSVR